METNESPQSETEQKETEKPYVAKGIFSRLKTYLLTGLLVTGPILITLYIAWAIITGVDKMVISLIPPQYNPENYVTFYIPGIGLAVVLTGLILVGMFAANFLGSFFVRLSDRILKRMPFLRGIYTASKQVMETVFANKSNAFREVVLVEFPRRGMWVMGFITAVTGGEIQNATEPKLLNVFIPTTPNPTSGFLTFVPMEDVYRVNMTVEEGLKLIISGGIITPPDKRSEADRQEPPYIRSREMLKDL